MVAPPGAPAALCGDLQGPRTGVGPPPAAEQAAGAQGGVTVAKAALVAAHVGQGWRAQATRAAGQRRRQLRQFDPRVLYGKRAGLASAPGCGGCGMRWHAQERIHMCIQMHICACLTVVFPWPAMGRLAWDGRRGGVSHVGGDGGAGLPGAARSLRHGSPRRGRSGERAAGSAGQLSRRPPGRGCARQPRTCACPRFPPPPPS